MELKAEDTAKMHEGLNRVNQLITMLNRIMPSFSEAAARLHEYEEVISQKRYTIMPLAQEILERIQKNPDEFLKNKEAMLERLKKENADFAEKAGRIKVPNPNELEVLMPLQRLMESYKNAKTESQRNLLARYLVQHRRAFVARLNFFEDRELAQEVGKGLAALSNQERYFLERYYNEVNQWPAMQQPIEEYANKLRAMLDGRQAPYLGLLSYFKDTFIAEEIRKRKPLRSLLTYQQQIAYLESLELMIEKGLRENDWRDFFAFWNNLDKEIGKVREDYGNETAAGIMEDIRKRYHEYPAKWKEGFISMLRMFRSADYERRVLAQAADEFKEVLLKAIELQEAEQRERLEAVEKAVGKKIKMVREWKENLTAQYAALLKRAQRWIRYMFTLEVARVFMKRWGRLKVKLVGFEDEINPAIERLIRYWETRNIHTLLPHEAKVDNILRNWLKADPKYIGRADLFLLGLAAYSNRIASEISENEFRMLNYTDKDIEELNNLIRQVWEFNNDMNTLRTFFEKKTKAYPLSIKTETATERGGMYG